LTESVWENVIKSLKDITPGVSRFIIEFASEEIYPVYSICRYVVFPKVLNAIVVAKKVFSEKNPKTY
jgi:hypothetical protein